MKLSKEIFDAMDPDQLVGGEDALFLPVSKDQIAQWYHKVNMLEFGKDRAERSVEELLSIIDEILPQAGKLVFQDYSKLNTALIYARKVLEEK